LFLEAALQPAVHGDRTSCFSW